MIVTVLVSVLILMLAVFLWLSYMGEIKYKQVVSAYKTGLVYKSAKDNGININEYLVGENTIEKIENAVSKDLGESIEKEEKK